MPVARHLLVASLSLFASDYTPVGSPSQMVISAQP